MARDEIQARDVANYLSTGRLEPVHVSRQLLPGARFAQIAQVFARKTALIGPGGRLSFAELAELVRSFGRGLQRLGVRPGEAIGVACGNRWELAPLFFGASQTGTVFTAFNPLLTKDELAWQMGELRPRLVIGEGHYRLEEILEADDGRSPDLAIDEQAPLMVRFSSGTTGKPKAIVNSQRAQLELYRSVIDMMAMDDQGVHLITGPLAHAPLHMGLAQILAGGTIVIPGRFDKTRFWSDCTDHGVTNAMMVPTMISSALDHPGEAPSLVRLMSTGAPLAVALKTRLLDRFPGLGLVETYGSSELGMVTALRPSDQHVRPASVGRATLGQEVAIFDDGGRALPAGEIGTIHVRGPMCGDGYVGSIRPTLTSTEQSGEGWVTSGDMGYLDEDGYLFISDRRVDLILSGGLNVYPAEVEAVLFEVAGVQDAAVVGIADDHWGQRVVAYVVGDAAPADIEVHCRTRLAAYKIPRAVHIVAALPRTPSGKTSRKGVRDLIQLGQLPS